MWRNRFSKFRELKCIHFHTYRCVFHNLAAAGGIVGPNSADFFAE